MPQSQKVSRAEEIVPDGSRHGVGAGHLGLPWTRRHNLGQSDIQQKRSAGQVNCGVCRGLLLWNHSHFSNSLHRCHQLMDEEGHPTFLLPTRLRQRNRPRRQQIQAGSVKRFLRGEKYVTGLHGMLLFSSLFILNAVDSVHETIRHWQRRKSNGLSWTSILVASIADNVFVEDNCSRHDQYGYFHHLHQIRPENKETYIGLTAVHILQTNILPRVR